MAMWRWFTECLSEGDGQPLQRLALGALSKLLSAADSTAPGGDDVSDILRSREFLKPFFRALAHNHKKEATEGGSTGGEQWSLGVKEVLQDAGRGDTRELVSIAVCVCVRVLLAPQLHFHRKHSFCLSGRR